MEQGKIHMFTGDGHGKTPAAIGEAIYAACNGKNVVVIQFLKADARLNAEFLRRLEPEIKFFRFEKATEDYVDLSEREREEEKMNILNGLNFAKKVLSTGECDLLIMDEVLGLVDIGIISVDELKNILDSKDEETTVIMTGIQLGDELCLIADEVSKIETMNYKVF